MGKLNRQSGTAWRATFVLLVLLLGALAPAARLLLPAPVTCGMACCLESGECCCLARFEGAHADEHDVATVLKQAELTKGCAPNCATSPVTSSSFLPKAERACTFNFARVFSSQRPHEQPRRLLAHFPLNAASPRAPPLLFASHLL